MSNILKILAFLVMLFFTPIGGFFFSFLEYEPSGFHDLLGTGSRSGTGFYINENIIVTSDQYTSGCNQLSILSSSNRQAKASLVKVDIKRGISILQTTETIAQPIVFLSTDYVVPKEKERTKLHDYTSTPGVFTPKSSHLFKMLGDVFIETKGHSFDKSNSGAPITDGNGVLMAMAHSTTTEQALLHFLGKKKTDLSVGVQTIAEILTLHKIPYFSYQRTVYMETYINNPNYLKNLAVNIICF